MKITAYHPVYTKMESELPFYITTIGISEKEDSIYRPGGIESFLLLYTEKGSGKVNLYGEEYIVKEGNLVIIPPYVTHLYTKNTDEWTTLWITFNGFAAKRFFDVKASVISLPENFDFKGKFNKLLEMKKGEVYKLQSSANLYSLLIECRELFLLKSINTYELKNKLNAAFEFIYDNYMYDIELSKLAECCQISPEHFCRLFKQYSGMRPVEYITKIRLQKAKELLIVDNNFTISEIAEKTGFRNRTYFSYVFKKNQGCSAEQFRKSKNIY